MSYTLATGNSPTEITTKWAPTRPYKRLKLNTWAIGGSLLYIIYNWIQGQFILYLVNVLSGTFQELMKDIF